MKVEEKKISNNHGRHSDGHAPLLLFFLRCRSLGPHDDSAAPPILVFQAGDLGIGRCVFEGPARSPRC
jgi:hypothetical protein